jgi:uncharacterized membrane protein
MKNKSIYIIIGLIILVIFVGVFYLESNILPSPKKTVRDYFMFIKNEKYENAYSLLTDNYLKSKGTFDEFKAVFLNVKAHGTSYESVKINNVKNTKLKSQKIVVFTLTIKEKGRKTESFGQYLVIKENNKTWKIADSLQ